jgi:predicted permease
VAYALGSFAVIGLGLWWARQVMGQTAAASNFYAMGMSCPNSGFVGYPILLLTFAPVAGVALALNMLVENILVIPVLLALAERANGDKGPWHRMVWQSLKKLAANPMIMGLAAGFVASLLEWTPPGPVTRTVNLFASACGVLSLFVIGGTLVGLPAQGMARQVTPIVLGKLLVHPAMVALALWALPHLGMPEVDATLRTAAVLTAAMPMMGIYPILALKYGQEGFSAAALLAATVLSFFSVSALLWLLH